MKKFLVLVMSIVMAAAVFAGCSQGSGDWDYIEKKGTLIVGFDPHFPPMGYFADLGETDASKATGFDIDLAKAVGEYLKVEIKLVSIDWSKKESELKSRNIDLIWNGYTMTEKRAANHLFSVPYMKNEQAILIRATDAAVYTSVESLADKKICYQKNSSAEDVVKAHAQLKNNTFIASENYGKALTELESNNVACVIMDSVAAYHYINENSGKYMLISDVSLGDENYGIGIRQGASLTMYKINQALYTLMENGKVMEIAGKYGLEDAVIL